MTTQKQFKPICKPYMNGVVSTRQDGIDIEVVQTEPGLWNLFLTRDDTVCGCSIEQYRCFGHRDCLKTDAMRIAKTLID